MRRNTAGAEFPPIRDDSFTDPFPNAPGGATSASPAFQPAAASRAQRRNQQSNSSSSRGQDLNQREPQTIFNAAVILERLRLTAGFEALYRQNAAEIEDVARNRVSEEAKRLFASESTAAAAASSSGGSLGDLNITRLEGQILQESVLAEQLRNSEAAREDQLRELQTNLPRAAAARPPRLGEEPPTVAQLRESLSSELGAAGSMATGEDLRAEAMQARSHLNQLQQRSWRAQNAVRASEAHEDLLQAHRKDLERKITEVQSHIDFVTPTQDRHGLELEPDVAKEAKELPKLELYQEELSEQLRQAGQDEMSAQADLAKRKQALQDLESDVGILWLHTGSGTADQEEAQIAALLSASMPHSGLAHSGGKLANMLEALDNRRDAIHEELQIDTTKGTGWQAREHERCDNIEKEVTELNAEAAEYAKEATKFQSDMKLQPRTSAEVEDKFCEASDLRRENEVMRRQQSQWQKSQLRMLRMVEDMQRKRYRDVQVQATVASRLSELQRVVPLQELIIGTSGSQNIISNIEKANGYPSSRSPSPPRDRSQIGMPEDNDMFRRGGSRLNNLWSDNVALQSKLRRLEDERVDLIKNQENLINLVKSKMPTIEAARSNMRMAHAVGEPRYRESRLGA